MAIMNNVAERIKEAVTMHEAARYYGLQVNRQGDAICPFHKEKTGSLHIYPGNRGWHCFGCGAGGDVITFVRMLFNLSFPDALAKLDEDFQLGLNTRKKRTPMQRVIDGHKATVKRQHMDLYHEALEKAEAECHEAELRVMVLDLIRTKYAPERPAELDDATLAAMDFDPMWAAALHMLPIEEYKLEQAEINRYQLEHSERLWKYTKNL